MNRQLIIAFFVIFLISSCSKVPITNRRQFRMLPDSMLLSLSITAYNDFIRENPPLPNSNADASKIKFVGQKMSESVNNYLRNNGHKKLLSQFRWEFQLVQNNAVNAWCMPGGKIVFYSGILPLTMNESGIATVMGHEMAHAVARHGNERMSQQLAVYLGGISMAIAMRDKPQETRNLFLAVYGVGGVLGTLAYSRKHEYEADKIGMIFMALAGYEPNEAILFWERMSAHSKSVQLPEFLSTHPHHDSRIAEMKKFLPIAQKYLKKS